MLNRLKPLTDYAVAVLLCLVILTGVMKLWRADFKVPFTYFGDALLYSIGTKGAIEQGWWFHNDRLGTPDILHYEAYPAIENFHFLFIKLISLFTSDYASTLNLFYLLTFPLTTITSLYFLKYFKFSLGAALFGSLLFTFLPYHFFRSYHLFLAAYYLIPLMVLVFLWVSSGVKLIRFDENWRWPRFEKDFKSIFSIVICVIVGSCGLYYPFFSCFFLLIAAVIAYFRSKSISAFVAPAILIAIIFGTLVINHLPLLIYQHRHGSSAMGQRSVFDAEIMGFKIAQLLLPIGGHRWGPLAALRYRYNLGPLVNENDTSSLGVIGSIGFLILLGALFRRRSNWSLIDDLSLLNISGVLLATIGGFGVLFALLISPQIRAYNRISIFIAFFSLVAITQVLDSGYKSLKQPGAKIGLLVIAGVMLVVGVLDQTNKLFFFVPEYEKIKTEYKSDADFVALIESSVPTQSMIFQLPYIPFPESPGFNKMMDHEPAKGYLHSKSLRWSYGAIAGERADLWQRAISVEPPAQIVDDLTRAGFAGIYLNRAGYTDNGVALESELTALLGKPLVSRQQNVIFYSLLTKR